MASSNLERWRRKQADVARSRRRVRSPYQIFFISCTGFMILILFFRWATSQNENEDRPIVGLKQPLDNQVKDGEVISPNNVPESPNVDQKVVEAPIVNAKPEPNLEEILSRLRKALAPFQIPYLKSIGEDVPTCDLSALKWSEPQTGFLSGCPSVGCGSYISLEQAKQACIEESQCGGVVASHGYFQIRSGRKVLSGGDDEISYVAPSCTSPFSATDIWEAFSSTLKKAQEDPSLNLDTSFGPAREDGSIYVSISSYRDVTCADTVRHLYARARNPSKVFVGLVQQNCNVEKCMTGTGWGSTRKWVPQDHPDPDCVEAFCAENKELCRTNVRVLRIGEREAYGPFFGRYLNSKLWRGENIYLQIDAHTEFRENWDIAVVDQLRLTPSYPNSVISNYPPSGNPASEALWPAYTGGEGIPSALCGMTFEGAGGRHKTVRLSQSTRKFSPNMRSNVPRHSAFVAAGFFAAHGSIVDKVPFDPYMPYLFMGEEISLSIRFWTNGFDIYAPSFDFLRHEYMRKDSPKFWESVGMVFNQPGIHNDLTNLIIPRVQSLVLWKDTPSELESAYTNMHKYQVGNARTRGQFVSTMNIDTENLKQHAPQWCIEGTGYPTN